MCSSPARSIKNRCGRVVRRSQPDPACSMLRPYQHRPAQLWRRPAAAPLPAVRSIRVLQRCRDGLPTSVLANTSDDLGTYRLDGLGDRVLDEGAAHDALRMLASTLAT